MNDSRLTAAIWFRITGAVRYLSHAEMSRLWQRACARAGVPVRYSEGFNPHPRLSLPLPRPVGVEADDELLLVKLDNSGLSVDAAVSETTLREALAAQLPAGIEVHAVRLLAAGASFHPQSAEYVFPVRPEARTGLVQGLRDTIAQVMGSERCLVERASAEGGAARTVDVRPFLCSIRLEDDTLIVHHRTGTDGSVRVNEIAQIFGLQAQDLAGPVRRTRVHWETAGAVPYES